MITEIGVKQVSYPAFDPSGQETGKRVTETVRPPGTVVNGATNATTKGHESGRPGKESGLSNEVLQAFKQEFDLINNVELKFNKDEETGQTYVKIVDKETGEVIREIPPEEVRKLAEKLDEMVGILLDKKA